MVVVATTTTAGTRAMATASSSSSPSPPPPPPRRRRSLTGPELYEQWHGCYDAGWHRRLMQLDKDEADAEATLLVAAFKADRQFAEFARFHNSQLVQPLRGVEHALCFLLF